MQQSTKIQELTDSDNSELEIGPDESKISSILNSFSDTDFIIYRIKTLNPGYNFSVKKNHIERILKESLLTGNNLEFIANYKNYEFENEFSKEEILDLIHLKNELENLNLMKYHLFKKFIEIRPILEKELELLMNKFLKDSRTDQDLKLFDQFLDFYLSIESHKPIKESYSEEKNYLIHIFSKSEIKKFADSFFLRPHLVWINICNQSNDNVPPEPKVGPDIYSFEFKDNHYLNSEVEVLNLSAYYLSYEVSRFPCIRKRLNEILFNYSTISTSPTPIGIGIDFLNYSYRTKRIRNKPLTDFYEVNNSDNLIFEILENHKKRLIDYEIHVDLKKLEEDKFFCLMTKSYLNVTNSDDCFTIKWNDLRKNIIKNSITKFIIPEFKNNILHEIAKNQSYLIERKCIEKLREIIRQDELKVEKILAFSTNELEEDFVYGVILDKNGHVLNVEIFRNLLKKRDIYVNMHDPENYLKLMKFIKNISNSLDYIIIPSNNIDWWNQFYTILKEITKAIGAQAISIIFSELNFKDLINNHNIPKETKFNKYQLEAISLARLKLNPIAEICNFWKKNKYMNSLLNNTNFHQYQNFISKEKLLNLFRQEIKNAVSIKGVNLNKALANSHLRKVLNFVPGLDKADKKRILDSFNSDGVLRSKKQIKDLLNSPNNCIPYLLIAVDNQSEPLDSTLINESDYETAFIVAGKALMLKGTNISGSFAVKCLIKRNFTLSQENKTKILEEYNLTDKKYHLVNFILNEISKDENRRIFENKWENIFYNCLGFFSQEVSKGTIVNGIIDENYENSNKSLIRVTLDCDIPAKLIEFENEKLLNKNEIQARIRDIEFEGDKYIINLTLKNNKSDWEKLIKLKNHDMKYFEINEKEDICELNYENSFNMNKLSKIKLIEKYSIKAAEFRPDFNYLHANTYLSSKFTGTIIFFPDELTSRRDQLIVCAWKIFNECILYHRILLTEIKEKIHYFLKGKSYESLNDLKVNFYEKCNNLITLVKNHNNFIEFSDMNEFESWLDFKKNTVNEFHYFITFLPKYHDNLILAYIPIKKTCIKEIVKISPKGLFYHEKYFDTIDEIYKYIKKNIITNNFKNNLVQNIKLINEFKSQFFCENDEIIRERKNYNPISEIEKQEPEPIKAQEPLIDQTTINNNFHFNESFKMNPDPPLQQTKENIYPINPSPKFRKKTCNICQSEDHLSYNCPDKGTNNFNSRGRGGRGRGRGGRENYQDRFVGNKREREQTSEINENDGWENSKQNNQKSNDKIVNESNDWDIPVRKNTEQNTMKVNKIDQLDDWGEPKKQVRSRFQNLEMKNNNLNDPIDENVNDKKTDEPIDKWKKNKDIYPTLKVTEVENKPENRSVALEDEDWSAPVKYTKVKDQNNPSNQLLSENKKPIVKENNSQLNNKDESNSDDIVRKISNLSDDFSTNFNNKKNNNIKSTSFQGNFNNNNNFYHNKDSKNRFNNDNGRNGGDFKNNYVSKGYNKQPSNDWDDKPLNKNEQVSDWSSKPSQNKKFNQDSGWGESNDIKKPELSKTQKPTSNIDSQNDDWGNPKINKTKNNSDNSGWDEGFTNTKKPTKNVGSDDWDMPKNESGSNDNWNSRGSNDLNKKGDNNFYKTSQSRNFNDKNNQNNLKDSKIDSTENVNDKGKQNDWNVETKETKKRKTIDNSDDWNSKATNEVKNAPEKKNQNSDWNTTSQDKKNNEENKYNKNSEFKTYQNINKKTDDWGVSEIKDDKQNSDWNKNQDVKNLKKNENNDWEINTKSNTNNLGNAEKKSTFDKFQTGSLIEQNKFPKKTNDWGNQDSQQDSSRKKDYDGNTFKNSKRNDDDWGNEKNNYKNTQKYGSESNNDNWNTNSQVNQNYSKESSTKAYKNPVEQKKASPKKNLLNKNDDWSVPKIKDDSKKMTNDDWAPKNNKEINSWDGDKTVNERKAKFSRTDDGWETKKSPEKTNNDNSWNNNNKQKFKNSNEDWDTTKPTNDKNLNEFNNRSKNNDWNDNKINQEKKEKKPLNNDWDWDADKNPGSNQNMKTSKQDFNNDWDTKKSYNKPREDSYKNNEWKERPKGDNNWNSNKKWNNDRNRQNQDFSNDKNEWDTNKNDWNSKMKSDNENFRRPESKSNNDDWDEDKSKSQTFDNQGNDKNWRNFNNKERFGNRNENQTRGNNQNSQIKCFNCNEPGHFSKDCLNPKNRKTKICSKCKKEGHFANQCEN